MEKVRIKSKYWDHTCGDGCCYTWGVDLTVNEEEITIHFAQDASDVLSTAAMIYKHLGYEVETYYDDDDGE